MAPWQPGEELRPTPGRCFPGYTQEEKIEIAHRHLIPKQLEQHGLTPQQIQIPQATTLDIITR